MTAARTVRWVGARPPHWVGVGGAQGVRLVGSLAALPLAAHLLAPAGFARLAACLCIAQVVAVALDGGIAATGYALLRSAGESTRGVFRQVTATKLRAIALFALPALAVAAIPRIDAATVLAAYAYGAALALNGFWWLNHQRRAGLAFVCEASPVAGLLAGAAALAIWRAPWWTLPLAGAVGGLIPPLILAARDGGEGLALAQPPLSGSPQRRVGFTRLLIAGYALALIPVATLRFDLGAVAAYAACDKAASVAGMLGLIAAQALAPSAARGELAARWSGRAGALILAFAAAAYLALAAAGGGAAVELLFGSRYRGLGLCALVAFAADGLVGLNTVIWTGVRLPSGRPGGYLRATAVGAAVCYAVLLAPLRGGAVQIACARLLGEVAVLSLSLAPAIALRPALRRSASPFQRGAAA